MWFARQTPLQFAINQQTGKQGQLQAGETDK